VFFYTPAGQKLGAYQFNIVQTSPTPTMYVTLMTSDRYFGCKLLAQQDRLGSAGDFYPWGEAKGGNNPADTWSLLPTGGIRPADSITPTIATTRISMAGS